MSEKLYTKDEVKTAIELVAATTTGELSDEQKIELTSKLPEELQRIVALVLLDAFFNLMRRREKAKKEMVKNFFQKLEDEVSKEEDTEEDSGEKKECQKSGCCCKGHIKARSFGSFDEFLKFLSQR